MRRRWTTLALAALALACRPTGVEAPFTVLEGDWEALRQAFNAEAGHVRVVMLASPT